MQQWVADNPDKLVGNPEEWVAVRQILAQWGELRKQGKDEEAKALWEQYADLLAKYYPATAGRGAGLASRGGGEGGRRRGIPRLPPRPDRFLMFPRLG